MWRLAVRSRLTSSGRPAHRCGVELAIRFPLQNRITVQRRCDVQIIRRYNFERWSWFHFDQFRECGGQWVQPMLGMCMLLFSG